MKIKTSPVRPIFSASTIMSGKGQAKSTHQRTVMAYQGFISRYPVHLYTVLLLLQFLIYYSTYRAWQFHFYTGCIKFQVN